MRFISCQGFKVLLVRNIGSLLLPTCITLFKITHVLRIREKGRISAQDCVFPTEDYASLVF